MEGEHNFMAYPPLTNRIDPEWAPRPTDENMKWALYEHKHGKKKVYTRKIAEFLLLKHLKAFMKNNKPRKGWFFAAQPKLEFEWRGDFSGSP